MNREEPTPTIGEEQLLALQAYHDGELSWFGRWRMERALASSPGLRRELAELRKLSGWMREIDREPDQRELPDLWSEIGPALSRIDAEVGNRAAPARTWKRDDWSWASLLASGAVAALVLAVFALDNGEGIPENPAAVAVEDVAGGSLRYLETHGVSYVVSQDSEDVTIIWLMDAPAAPRAVEGA